MSDDSRHVMFADCFHEIGDDELMAEYARVMLLPSSNWQKAVFNEIEERGLIPRETIPDIIN